MRKSQRVPRPGRRSAARRGAERSRHRPDVEPLESRALLTLTPLSAYGLDLGVSSNPMLDQPIVSVAIDNNGFTYLAGTFRGSVNFNPGGTAANRTSQGGSQDIFVARYTPSGQLDWLETFGSTGEDVATGIALAAGRVFVSGLFTGTIDFDPGPGTRNLSTGGVMRFDGFILALDANAHTLVYASQIAGGSAVNVVNTANAIAADPFGNAYITGRIQGTANFAGLAPLTTRPVGATGSEVSAFVAKLNPSGAFQWARQFSGVGASVSSGQGNGVAVDGAGNVLTTGRYSQTVDFDPGAGQFTQTTQGNFPDAYISKLNANGDFVWARRLGSSDFDVGEGVAVDGSNNVYVTGKFTSPGDAQNRPIPVDLDPGPGAQLVNSTSQVGANGVFAPISDIFTLKLNANGDFQWAVPLRIRNHDSQPGRGGIAVLPNGIVYVGASFRLIDRNKVNRGNEAVLFQLDTTGRFLGLVTGGSTANDVVQGVAVNANGRVAISGITLGAATFGNVTLPAARDNFVAIYNSTPGRIVAESDYDGDGLTDPTVFDPRTSTFYISRSSLGNVPIQFGQGTIFGGNPIPVAEDYDGDGRTDPSVFDPRTSTFFVSRSSLGNVPIQFGQGQNAGGNPIPIPADYDGDGKVDVAVYEPSTSTFALRRSTAGNVLIQFGQGENAGGKPIPIPADYDGDGKVDIAVYEPSTSTFALGRTTLGNVAIQFGQGRNAGGDPIPIPADYDGDGKVDIAVYEPSTSTFALGRTTLGNTTVQFGQGRNSGGSPIPVPADYDGDGKVDVAVFEPSTSTFALRRSTAGNVLVQFGKGTNFGGNPIPIPADFDGDGKVDAAVFEPSTATFGLARSTQGNILIQFGQGTLFGGAPIPQPLPQVLRYSRTRRLV